MQQEMDLARSAYIFVIYQIISQSHTYLVCECICRDQFLAQMRCFPIRLASIGVRKKIYSMKNCEEKYFCTLRLKISPRFLLR